jgi:hypothetical protein
MILLLFISFRRKDKQLKINVRETRRGNQEWNIQRHIIPHNVYIVFNEVQCLSRLMLWVRISIRARCTTLSNKVCQWLVTGRWFSKGPPVSSTNKTDHHDTTEILLKVALSTIKQTNKQTSEVYCSDINSSIS